MIKLGRDVYLALAAIGWADGKLDADESRAIVGAARDEGLDAEALAAIEAAVRAPVTLDFLDQSAMGKDDRLFVYAMGSWIARIDGAVTAGEATALDRLAKLLGVGDRLRRNADALVHEIASAPGATPRRYDLASLRRTFAERLIEAEHLR